MKNSYPDTEPRRVDVSDEEEATKPAQNRETPARGDEAAAGDADSQETLQNERDKYRDLALRAQADLDNYKKRAAREKEDAIKYANSSLLERLIAIIDNFELGLSAAKNESADSPILSGMGMVLKQLNDFLADNGLQPIDAEGKPFDPNLHEAIAHEPSATVPEEHVVKQVRRGYKWKDRLLRPSAVVVSSGRAK